MQEQIVVYRDASFMRPGETTVDSYFEYMLSSSEFQVIRAGEPDELETLLRNTKTKLVLFYLENGKNNKNQLDNILSYLSCVRTMTEKPVVAVCDGILEGLAERCLAYGADDYCDATCSVMELVARIKAQIRTYNRITGCQARLVRKLSLQGLVVDDVAKQVTVEGKPVNLTPLEYKILYLLMEKPGRVLSNKQIYETIWHMEPIGADNTIAVHIRHLREKIEENPKEPKWVQVVWGQGYKVC